MELFKIFGTLAINGVDKAKKELNETSGTAGKVFSSLGKGAATVGKVVGAGLVAASGAVVALGTAAIKSYGDYEQLVGGVETLFGTRGTKSVEEYAESVGKSVDAVGEEFATLKRAQETVMEDAAIAFKTAGLSMNEYMEIANGMGAALNQSSGSQLESARLANMAIIDMSDNAAKMGTSMEAIQNAYNGFSKQNYTMLDNLKLGYGGTKTEMERLLKDAEKISGIKYDISSFSDVTKAIHVMQEKMGIAGTTAKEAAGTIQGSFGMLKGAWTNLMTGLSDPNADLDILIEDVFTSVTTFAQNLIPRITQVLGGIATAIEQLVPLLASEIPNMLNAVLPSLIQGAVALVEGLAVALPSAFKAVLDVLPTLIDGIAQMFTNLTDVFRDSMPSMLDGLSQLMDQIVAALPGLVESIANALPSLVGGLIDGFIILFSALVGAFPSIIEPLVAAMPEVITSIVASLVTALPLLIEGFSALINGLIPMIPELAQMIVAELPVIFELLTYGILSSLPALISACAQLVAGLVTALPQIWAALNEAIPAIFEGIFAGIGDVFAPLIEKAKTAFESMKTAAAEKLSGMWETVSTYFSELPGKIGEWLSNTIESITTWAGNIKDKAVEAGKNFLDGLVKFFMELPGKIKTFLYNALVAITGTLIALPILAYRYGKEFVEKLVQFFKELPGKIKNFLTNTLNNVKTWATNMANKAKEAGTKFVNTIVTFFTQLPGKIWTFLSNVISKVTTWATNMASKAKAAATQFITNAVNTIQALPGKIWTFLSNVISKVAEWGSQMMAKGKAAATQLVQTVVSTIKEMPGKVADVGRNLVEGIWKGISNAKAWLKGKIKEFVGDVTSFMKNVFGIHSPATLWRDEIGVWLAKGLAEGITDGTSDVEKASAALGEAAANSAFVSDAFREAAEKGVEEYTDTVNEYRNKYRNTIGKTVWADNWKTMPLDELHAAFGVDNRRDMVLLTEYSDYLRALMNDSLMAKLILDSQDIGQDGKSFRIVPEDYDKGNGKMLRTIRIMKDGVETFAHTFEFAKDSATENLSVINDETAKNTAVVKKETDEQEQTLKEKAEKRLNNYTVYNKMTLSEEAAYWNEVRKMAAEGTDERIELDKKYFEVKQNLDDQMLAAEEELQSTLSDIYGKVADRKKSILDSYGLFGDGDTTTDDFYFRLYGQVKGLEQYQKDIDALEARIGGTGLYEAIKEMGLDAHEELVKINGMTDDALQNYVELYDKRSELAGKLAKDELKDTVAAETEAAYKQFATTVAELGGDVQLNTTSVFDSMRQKAVEAGEAIGACEQHLRSMFDMYANDMAAMFGEDSALANFSDPSIMTTMAVANNHSNDDAVKELPKEQKEFNSGIMERIRSMDERLRTGFAQLAEAFDVDIVLDSGVLVGALAADMNVELGKISMRKDRGR